MVTQSGTVIPSADVNMALLPCYWQENIIISETIHDRGEITIEHTLEVMVAHVWLLCEMQF